MYVSLKSKVVVDNVHAMALVAFADVDVVGDCDIDVDVDELAPTVFVDVLDEEAAGARVDVAALVVVDVEVMVEVAVVVDDSTLQPSVLLYDDASFVVALTAGSPKHSNGAGCKYGVYQMTTTAQPAVLAHRVKHRHR